MDQPISEAEALILPASAKKALRNIELVAGGEFSTLDALVGVTKASIAELDAFGFIESRNSHDGETEYCLSKRGLAALEHILR